MRFGQQLRSSLIKDYYHSYIAYDDLKASLKNPLDSKSTKAKPNLVHRKWTEDDEQRFVRQLEQELDKVFTFQHVRSDDIIRRIKASEKEVSDVIAKQQQADDTQNKSAEPPSDEDYELLEEDLSDIIADVHDLAKFTQLNYTGFQKIIKKHDKTTGWHLKPVFATRLSAKPFWKDNYDNLIVKLSRLYDLVRTRGNPAKGDSAAGGGQQNFVRQTTKYWVHPDNITELKLIVLKHLPVLVFNASKEFEAKDSAISSIYYDNTDTWELYMGRLKKTEGAEAIRLRWYGGMDTDTIFVERKTHREDWTGEKSVKARFSLKEKNVNDFLAGRMTVEQAFAKMRKEGKKSDKEISELEQLAREIQFRVLDRKYVPVTRSFYNRTAFQLPGDARVRISLDTELTMTREDNLDGKDRAGKNWRRMDIGIDYPFSQLPPEDAERFPYAVLEVKLQTAQGQEPPQWIRDLTASHLVEALPKYSKFIHGTAVLNPTRINLLPFWIPQMETDIRKPATHHFGIEHPTQSQSASTNLDDYSDDDDEDLLDSANGDGNSATTHDNENMRRLRAAREAMEAHEIEQQRAISTDGTAEEGGQNTLDEEERINASNTYDQDYPVYDSDDEDQPTANDDYLAAAKRAGPWQYRAALVRKHVTMVAAKAKSTLLRIAPIPKATDMPQRGDAMGIPRGSTLRTRFYAPKGKKIHVPVRVEPKVFFAAERTFLSWLEFSILIGSIAATLLNFGDRASLASAVLFTVLACVGLCYAMGMYLWRARAIRERRAVQYHDKWGPSVLCGGLVLAVGASFVLRFVGGFNGDGGLKGGLKG